MLLKLTPAVVDTAGLAGSATGTAKIGVPGFSGPARLVALGVAYHAAAPATTDVVVSATAPIAKTLLTLTDRNTDLPLAQVTEASIDGAGADRADYRRPIVAGEIEVTVAQCDPLDGAVTVEAVVEL
jgi:hypothetical protein